MQQRVSFQIEREMRLNWENVHLTSPPPTQQQEQPLDHFNAFNDVYFNQSYWINTEFVNASCSPSLENPLHIFLYVCAEETCGVGRTLGGALYGYARQYGAAIVSLQHRFYGDAMPFPDRTPQHLTALSAIQALADIDWFLTSNILPTLNASSVGFHKIVAFGGSYGGQLAAWLRLKYPHLIHAAVASSGPVFTGLDFPGYDDVVGKALGDPINGGSPQCFNTLSQGFEAVASGFIGNNASARSASVDALQSCTALTESPLDPSFAMTSVANIFKSLIQTSGQWFNKDGIPSICGNLSASMGIGASPLEALKDFIVQYIKSEWGGGCQSLGYKEFNSWISNSSIPGPDYRLWYWQSCTEQGKAQTSLVPGTSSPFSSLGQTAQEFYEQCGEVFGEEKVGWEGAQRFMGFSLAHFGGLNISATRVVFVNGGADPYSAGGIRWSSDPLQPAVFIPGASHCADMGEPSSDDSPAMQQAHKAIASYLDKFLALN